MDARVAKRLSWARSRTRFGGNYSLHEREFYESRSPGRPPARRPARNHTDSGDVAHRGLRGGKSKKPVEREADFEIES